jgi:hypothetical protein
MIVHHHSVVTTIFTALIITTFLTLMRFMGKDVVGTGV